MPTIKHPQSRGLCEVRHELAESRSGLLRAVRRSERRDAAVGPVDARTVFAVLSRARSAVSRVGGPATQGSGCGVVVGPLTVTVAGDAASFQTSRSRRSVRGAPGAARAW